MIPPGRTIFSRQVNLRLWLLFTLLGLAGVCAQAEVKISGDRFVYKKVAGRELAVYLIKPEHSANPPPVIIWFHGGGWTMGGPQQFEPQAKYLATRGVAGILAEYRLLSGQGGEAPFTCMEDAKSCVRWVRSHIEDLGLDPKRIGLGGGSAGGQLAAFAALVPGYEAAQDDKKIPTRADLLVLFNPVVAIPPGTDLTKRFGPRTGEFIAASAINYLSADAPPTIIFHGRADQVVPPALIEQYVDKARGFGTSCAVVFYEGQGHAFFAPEKSAGKYFRLTLTETDKFLRQAGWVNGPPQVEEYFATSRKEKSPR